MGPELQHVPNLPAPPTVTRMMRVAVEEGRIITVDAADGEFLFENGPRGEKVAVGITSGGEINSSPDLAVASGE